MDLLTLHRRTGEATRRIVANVRSEQWHAPTLTDWDVRGLINHIVTGHLWAAELAQGKTIADVGNRLDGDVLGDDPAAAYDSALRSAQAAFERPGALEAKCHLSYGDVPGRVYAEHRVLDTLIHGWDVATATGQDDTLEPELVQELYAIVQPQAKQLQASGAFGQPVEVPEDADMQTKLLGMLGRRR